MTNEEQFLKWSWMADWCKEHKVSPYGKINWDAAKEAWKQKFETKVEPWQPRAGEWCWFFTDKMQLDNVGILRKFTQMESDIEDNDMFGCEPTVSDKEEFESIKVFYKYCEPFIGNLPSFIKEK